MCFVEKPRGNLFDCLSQREKLRHAGAAFCTLHSRKLVQRGVADLTEHNLPVIPHGKPDGQPFRVVPDNLVTDQWHGTIFSTARTRPISLLARGLSQLA